MVHTLLFFFSSNCSLFHNSNVFCSCIIYILYTGCAKIKKIIPAPKGLIQDRDITACDIIHANLSTSHFAFEFPRQIT